MSSAVSGKSGSGAGPVGRKINSKTARAADSSTDKTATFKRARDAKNIVLFSDGTGNSSAKLFKTNVWRIYEAVDLGPSPPGKRDQIAYYDDGVGTSAFKPLAMLSGIFGIGLKRNLLDIYRYACRNYRPGADQLPGDAATNEGDYIFAFGFSRGAFTIRMLIALIADQGLVPYTSEEDLIRDSAAAFRRFRRGTPRYAFSPMRFVLSATRMVGDGWRRLRRVPRYNPDLNYRPVIRFVGVWDTVAAYGGPIVELTRAIDNWVYRLSMPDQTLHHRVQTARHALALDDERDSFQPLLWDELNEEDLIRKRTENPGAYGDWITEDRLEQVWFCGMHADVGGGYPDESLSYVSLLWMIEEADKAGLRTLKSITERYRALANSFGPMHNSRAGVAAYYRYQPRNINAWLDPIDPATLSWRDPALPRGLITTVKIHESVIARIASGTDRYAPFSLPANFEIHPPGELAENLPQEDSQRGPDLREADRIAMVDPEDERRLTEAGRTEWARQSMGAVWDRVWLRRVTYFATLTATLLLVAMPLWISVAPTAPFLVDGRTWLASLIGLTRAIAPQFLGPWIGVYEHNSFYFLVLLIIVVLLLGRSTRLELQLRDETRAIWQQVLTAPSIDKLPLNRPASWLEKFRTSWAYQRTLQFMKWHVLPDVFGPVMLVLALWVAAGVLTQTALPELERHSGLCPAPTGQPDLRLVSRDFSTRALCNPMAVSVRQGEHYDVSFYVVDDWKDSDRPATPKGLGVNSYRWGAGYFGVPFKRVVNAGYLQPIIEIRPPDDRRMIISRVFMYPLRLTRDSDNLRLYRGSFTAPQRGDLYLFANDAVFPFTGSWAGKYNTRFFYEQSGPGGMQGNSGTACVLIARSDAGGNSQVSVVSRVCIRAAEQARAFEAAKAQAPGRPAYLLQ
jgi:uncharacterized protein (DUF2235 family)